MCLKSSFSWIIQLVSLILKNHVWQRAGSILAALAQGPFAKSCTINLHVLATDLSPWSDWLHPENQEEMAMRTCTRRKKNINMHILKIKQEAHVSQSFSTLLRTVYVLSARSDLCVSPKSVLSMAHLSPPCLQHSKHDRRSQHSLNFYSNDLFVKLEQRN